jgi:1-pyrroline-5-carboxylate dehydrogenase
MAETTFKLTYATMFDPPEELHSHFEGVLAEVKANLGAEHGMIINGEDRFADQKFEDHSPSNTDQLLGVFQKGTAQDADDAIAAARQAFPLWSGMKWQERVSLLRKAADLIDQRTFEIGAVMALEVGKNRMESLGDIAETADLIRYACYQMEKNEGYVVEMDRDPLVGYSATNISMLRPYGVWLVISPFNFPAALTGGPSGSALVLGSPASGGVLPRCGTARWGVQLRDRSWQHAGPGIDRQSRC